MEVFSSSLLALIMAYLGLVDYIDGKCEMLKIVVRSDRAE